MLTQSKKKISVHTLRSWSNSWMLPNTYAFTCVLMKPFTLDWKSLTFAWISFAFHLSAIPLLLHCTEILLLASNVSLPLGCLHFPICSLLCPGSLFEIQQWCSETAITYIVIYLLILIYSTITPFLFNHFYNSPLHAPLYFWTQRIKGVMYVHI